MVAFSGVEGVETERGGKTQGVVEERAMTFSEELVLGGEREIIMMLSFLLGQEGR